MKSIIPILIFLLFYNISFTQNIKDFNTEFMLRGSFYAKSSIADSLALGGFGTSSNTPKKLKKENNLRKSDLFLKIDNSKEIVVAKSYYGYKFYIVNRSTKTHKFMASDSRLDIVAEAYIDNKWQPIEYLPSSFCGNSYHSLYLKPYEYWEFEIPKFHGSIKTKIRYCLKQGNKEVYSNEIEGSINKTQLSKKEGSQSKGLMDPYND